MNYRTLCKKYLRDIQTGKVTSQEIEEYQLMVRDEIEYLIANNERDRLASALTLGIGIHLEEAGKGLVLDGNLQGWTLLEQELIWFSKSIMEEKDRTSQDARNFGGVIGMAMHWQYWELAAGVAEVAKRTFEANPTNFHNNKTLHLFVTALWFRYKESVLPDFFSILPTDHIYQKLIAAWNDLERFADLLDEVCDFHVFSAHDDQKDKMVELLAFDFIPFDIRAIAIVREKEGLPMPKITHPLLNSPLGNIPLSRPGYDSQQDQILQWVMREQR